MSDPNKLKSTTLLIVGGGLVIYWLLAFHGPSQTSKTEQDSGIPQVQVRPDASSNTTPAAPPTEIPKDIQYDVIRTDVIPGIKRALEVRLNRKVPEDVLRAIAIRLKTSDSRTFQRTLIVYYLPGMVEGSGAWATTHFDPDLKINILGMAQEQEHNLLDEKESASRQTIGRWLNEGILAARISIYRENGTLYIEEKFAKDGTILKEELVEIHRPSGRAFKWKEPRGPDDHDYYVIDKQGNLQIRDDDGLVSTARKID